MKITKLPPGEAIGARDLQRWASRRMAGLSGVGWDDDDDVRRPRGGGTQDCRDVATIQTQEFRAGVTLRNGEWSAWVEIPPPSVARDGVMFERYSTTRIVPVVLFGTITRVGSWLWITPVAINSTIKT